MLCTDAMGTAPAAFAARLTCSHSRDGKQEWSSGRQEACITLVSISTMFTKLYTLHTETSRARQ